MTRLLVCALLLAGCKALPTAADPACMDCLGPSQGGGSQFVGCGDGVTQFYEECDDGAGNGDDKACTNACLRGFCGDGLLRPDSEACDDGNSVTEACAYEERDCVVCRSDCTLGVGRLSYCGDGVTSFGDGEACDAGPTPNPQCPYGYLSCKRCGADCQWHDGSLSYCGDGIKQADEECDDARYTPLPCAYGVTGCTSCDRDCRFTSGPTQTCGDGVTNAPYETCDVANVHCVGCQAAPGWTCNNSTCAERTYRVAAIDGGTLRVRDLSGSGQPPIARRDISRGANSDTTVAWSWDGQLVTYPVGDYSSATYVYEGTGGGDFLAYFFANQAKFGSPPNVLGQDNNDYAVLNVQSNISNSASVPACQVRTPEYEPITAGRFAFLDGTVGATQNLAVYDSGTVTRIDGVVSRYAWSPLGGQLAYVRGSGTCTIRVVNLSNVANKVTVATNTACTARLAYSPDGDKLAVGNGSNLHVLTLSPAASGPYNVGSGQGFVQASSGPVSDVRYTPDGRFIAYLDTFAFPHVWLYGPSGRVDTGFSCACDNFAMSPALP